MLKIDQACETKRHHFPENSRYRRIQTPGINNQFQKAAQACKAPIAATTAPIFLTPLLKYQAELAQTIADAIPAMALLTGKASNSGLCAQW